ncbi:Maf-like protein [Clostridium sp. MSJ-11]|uniref:dTTP/UTP pyrophosphatase n=1 Tax=Clostridium mobile TaxID=2841512 RepID=A0ABS6EED8_9CLOT|nr:Maf-like protein [Clostridium mobile]MBU5483574.1 Maf-like protein [Clostridium mobile]
MRIILASASERRKELLKRILGDFEVIVSQFDEDQVRFNGDCGNYVIELAKGKGMDVVSNIKDNNSLIIACDTVVFFNGKVLGKPKSEEEAFSMLKELSGNVHHVYSGIFIYNKETNSIMTDYICTEVKFSNLSDELIKKYIESKEPFDKAGAYGIQGYGGIFVERINGCYYNVVGLPLNSLYKMLKEMGVNL